MKYVPLIEIALFKIIHQLTMHFFYVGPTSYVNQESLSSVSTDKSEMDGGGNGSVNTRPFLKKKIDPRYQLNPEVEGTEHADLDFPTTNA